jgi:hypothetical protein
MSLTTTLYVIELLCNLVGVLVPIFVVSIGTLLLLVAVYVFTDPNDRIQEDGRISKLIKLNVLILSLCSILLVLIPSKQSMQLMVTSSVVSDLSKDPKIQQVSDKILDVINKKLDNLGDK